MLNERDNGLNPGHPDWSKGLILPKAHAQAGLGKLSSLVIENGGEVRGDVPASRMLWGAAPTGAIHLGYCGYFGLLREVARHGIEPVVVVADYHAYLDSEKSRWHELDQRAEHYSRVLEAAGFTDVKRTRVSYSDPQYFEGLMKLSKHFGVEQCLQSGKDTFAIQNRSAAEVLYVLTQVYDLSFFGVDSVTCGLDESDIYRMGVPILGGYESIPRQQWYLPMCPGLSEKEMHASDSPNNKILVTDEPESLMRKLEQYREGCASAGNRAAIFEYLDNFLFPLYGMEPVRRDGKSSSLPNGNQGVSKYVERLEVILSCFYRLNH